MKEAAYKAHQRRFQLPRKLNWLTQNCSQVKLESENASGIIEIGNYSYASTSTILKNYIHTVASALPHIPSKNVILETSSSAIKNLLLTFLASHYSVDPAHLELHKDGDGIPQLHYQKRHFPTSFSLSGHGRFSGFSVVVNDL